MEHLAVGPSLSVVLLPNLGDLVRVYMAWWVGVEFSGGRSRTFRVVAHVRFCLGTFVGCGRRERLTVVVSEGIYQARCPFSFVRRSAGHLSHPTSFCSAFSRRPSRIKVLILDRHHFLPFPSSLTPTHNCLETEIRPFTWPAFLVADTEHGILRDWKAEQ